MPLIVTNDDRPCHREIRRIKDHEGLSAIDFVQVRLYTEPPEMVEDAPPKVEGAAPIYHALEVFVVSPYLWQKPLLRSRICTFALLPPLDQGKPDFGDRLSMILGTRELDQAYTVAHNWKIRPMVQEASKRKG